MKRIYYIATLIAALFAALPMQAQEEAGNNQQQQRRRGPEASRGARTEEKKETGMPELTVRAQDMNERMTQHIGNARWMRVIYRQIDLMKEPNAPLYYPTQPMNGQMNLFSIIFQLVCEGKLFAYEYLDGYEDFSDNRKLDLKVMLDRSRIFYEETPAEGNGPASFVVNESDIPSADVKSYYIKEAWYFDQNNSVFDVKTLAICPILTINDEMGQNTMPMFWIPYENLRPYINTAYIMTSNVNNAMTFTIDDYFRRRMFQGDIFKTQNLMNQPLQAYCPTPDSLKREQERIENQLIAFEKALYLQPDTTQQVAEEKGGKKSTKKATTASRGNKTSEVKETKTKAPKAKAPKTQSSAVRSVRRR